MKLPSLPVWSHWNSMRLIKESQENPRAFARGFQMKAFTDSERMFPSFQSCYAHGVVVGDVARRGWPVFIGVDLAGPRRPGTVLFAVALNPQDNRRYPVEIQVGSWTSPETAQRLAQMHDRHPNTRFIMVENNGYQQALVDWINHSQDVTKNFYYKVEAFTTGANKVSPEVGLPSLEIEFKNKAWVVPVDEFAGHPPTCSCGWCTWTTQMRDYPFSAATDSVMACWFAREGIAKWGGSRAVQGQGLSGLNVR